MSCSGRTEPSWQATAGTLIVLCPGAGGQNLFTAFQIGFLLATALGCLALAVSPRRPGLAARPPVDRGRDPGVGLFYLAATAVRLLGRREIAWLLVPIALYGVWFVTYGLDALGIHGSPAPAAIPAYVAYGIATAFGQGFPIVGAIVIALVAISIRGRALERLVLASVVGLAIDVRRDRRGSGPVRSRAGDRVAVRQRRPAVRPGHRAGSLALGL